MKILLTGASSFTGYWFAHELRSQGHSVVCTMTGASLQAYTHQKSERRVCELVAQEYETLWGVEFGTEKFCQILAQGGFDLVCFHGAYIPDYRSRGFNLAESLRVNLNGIQRVFSGLAKGATPFILTGTVFETGEGDLGHLTNAASPYGLAKRLVSEAFEYYSQQAKVSMGKFVIPNPIGPFEDRKFTAYLMDCWKKNQAATVKTPLYVRDNIHVKLLAKAYADFANRMLSAAIQPGAICVSRPSGYRETQGEFTHRFAEAMRKRLDLKCEFKLDSQIDFSEPLSRVNEENASLRFPDFSEEQAWDELAEYYR